MRGTDGGGRCPWVVSYSASLRPRRCGGAHAMPGPQRRNGGGPWIPDHPQCVKFGDLLRRGLPFDAPAALGVQPVPQPIHVGDAVIPKNIGIFTSETLLVECVLGGQHRVEDSGVAGKWQHVDDDLGDLDGGDADPACRSDVKFELPFGIPEGSERSNGY